MHTSNSYTVIEVVVFFSCARLVYQSIDLDSGESSTLAIVRCCLWFLLNNGIFFFC